MENFKVIDLRWKTKDKYEVVNKRKKENNEIIMFNNIVLPIVLTSTQLGNSMGTITNCIDDVSFWLRALGCSVAIICGTKNVIGCMETGNKQKAISCTIDTGIMVACLFLISLIVDFVKHSFGG